MSNKQSYLRKFILGNLKHQICSNIVHFFDNKKALLDNLTPNIKDFYGLECSNFTIKTIDINDELEGRVNVYIHLTPTLKYHVVRVKRFNNDDLEMLDSLWLTITLRLNLNDLSEYEIEVENYNKKTTSLPLDENMVPIINSNQYSKYANAIIEKYYGLRFNDKFRVLDLAKKIGLKVYKLPSGYSFSKDKNIYGMVFFERTEFDLYIKHTDSYERFIIDGQAIVYDPCCLSLHSIGCEDITIAHEIVHFELHKNFYLFMKAITNSDLTYISCQNDGVAESTILIEEDTYLEPQANGIAPFLVMPEERFIEEADNLIKYFSSEYNHQNEYMELVITLLKDSFHSNIYSVKKRLKELGYLDGVNVLEWDRDKESYTPTTTYKKGSLKSDETYTIINSDYLSLIKTDISLLSWVTIYNCVFVENHVVYDDPKYVTIDSFGNSILTKYAREHLDECAIKFKIKNNYQKTKRKSSSTFCYLCKGMYDDMMFDVNVSQDNTLLRSKELPELQAKHYDVEKQIYRMIEDYEGRLGDFLNELIKLYGFVGKSLTGIQAGTLSRYLNDKVEKVDIRKAICLCLSFGFTFKVSQAFIDTFSKQKLGRDDESRCFINILIYMRKHHISQINAYLKSSGFDPLST